MTNRTSWTISRWWALYALFVVYGSLVPLDYRPLPADEAWARFQQIPFLNLGVASRADWIANGVLYAPLGFLGALALLQRGWWRPGAVFLAVAAAWVLAVTVEYTQLYFPARTVSQNDLVAEAIGSVVGAGVAIAAIAWRARWRPLQQAGSHWLHDHALTLYAIAYFAYSLFPYDLLISSAEFAEKLASDRWGWWLAGAADRPLLTAVRLAIELLLAAPLGALLATRRPAAGWQAALALGLGVGLAIELAQLCIATGTTQGASVLARAGGFVLGAALWTRRDAWNSARARAVVARAAPWIFLPYLLLLFGVNGWLGHPWGGPEEAIDTLARLRWQPFYYHYFTSEAVALMSLTSVAFSYAPVGLWAWARRTSPFTAALVALVLCTVIEAGKLFLEGLRPDPTNLGIAALTAALVAWAIERAGQPAATLDSAEVPPRRQQAHEKATTQLGSPGLWLLAALALGWQLLSAPPYVVPTTLLVTGAALTVAWRPALAPLWLMAALPLFDLASWTGRGLWDEFDLLLVLVLAMAWARTPSPAVPHSSQWMLGVGLVTASLVLSASIGVWSGGWPDANALASYHSPYNALRIAKGLLWAVLLTGLWRRLDSAGYAAPALFARGTLAGLAGVVAWVLWERWAFVGFGDWGVDYRVTGPFSAMHRGGAFVECYIAIAMPVAAQAAIAARSIALRMAAAVLLVAGGFAMMLTFSRNGYAALALALLVWAVLALRARGRHGPTVLVVLALLVGIGAATVPVLRGEYAQERLARWERDLEVRTTHWRNALALRNGSWTQALFGIGLGRFPDQHYWLSREDTRAARLLVVDAEASRAEDPATFLRMVAGTPTYLDQIVSVSGLESVTLALRMRASAPGARLTVSLCEKWMLTSAACAVTAFPTDDAVLAWHSASATLDLTPLAYAPHWRPVKLALHTPSGDVAIDVTDISLLDAEGRELLTNGDFNRGFDNWWMSTDIDPPYHVHSLPVAVLLEQGWFGVLTWIVLLTLALLTGTRAAWAGNPVAAVAVAALAAYGVSGSLNTLIDEPRFLLLLLLLAWVGISSGQPRPTRLAGTHQLQENHL